MSRSSQIKLKPTNSCQLLLVLALFVSLQHQANSSGIFELNLSALQDSYGRDLRLDCCAWQNASQDKQHQMQLGSNLIQSATTQSVSNGLRYQAATAASGATETCDPTKCQLIVRICVKNYQTQIDPSQCTFGELTAQVMRPEPHQLRSQGSGSSNNHHHHSQQHPNHMSSLARLQQQQQLAAYQKMKGLNGAGSMMGQQQQQQPANIHLQRMLQQQTAYQTTLGSTSSEQHARLYHQVPPSAQSRSLRQVAFDQPISFPFNFTWPGAFSLVIDAWYESPTGLQQLAGGPFSAQAYQSRLYHQAPSAGHHGGLQQQHQQQQQQQQHLATSYDLYKKQLIMQHSMHGWLTVKNEWTSGMHRNDAAQLVYSYRVTCQPNYYGEQCNILCRPRDDVYGHFVCSDQGDVMCLPGWQGKYCEDPICTPGCHKDQGNCTRPNECNCRYGWQGPACEQCVRYPGCVHGTCSKPHDCNCEEGWGGLLCNEDLRYCTNHQPCKNGATCRNKFDEETGEGTYVCICEEGFAGKNCERRVSALENNAQQSAASLQQQQQPSQQTQSNQTQSLTNWSSSNQMHGPGSSQLSVNSNGPTARGGNKFPAATTTTMAANKANQPASNNLLESRTPQPVPQQVLATAPNGASLDHRVMVAYGIIIVCMVILVVLLLLRFFFERLSGAVVSCGQRLVSSDSDGTIWSMISSASAGIGGQQQQQQHESGERRRSSSRRHRHHYHHRHLHHQSTRSLGLNANHEHDVATLQNHQNIYKSRSSLGTDKMAMVYGTNELCSASSTTSSSVSSSSAEDLADHHRALQAQYSASAHYGHLHPHHAHPHQPHQQQHQQHHHALSALNPSALYGSSVGALASHHHHLPLPPVHPVHSLHPHAHLNHHHHHHPADPYHAMAAHSVHNLSSATYQHLNERLSQQPPPPPYTISGSMLGNSQQRQSAAALASSIYNTHSTTYAPANSIYGGATYRHPASLILGPPLPVPNANSIYNTNEPTYGTAAALAAHCVSASNYSLGRSAPANSQQQQQRSEPQEAKSKAKGSSTSNNESGAGQQERDETANASSNSESDETTTTTTATAAATTTTTTTASNPYGNLQQRAPTSERTDERPNEANEWRAQSQQANFFTFDHN